MAAGKKAYKQTSTQGPAKPAASPDKKRKNPFQKVLEKKHKKEKSE